MKTVLCKSCQMQQCNETLVCCYKHVSNLSPHNSTVIAIMKSNLLHVTEPRNVKCNQWLTLDLRVLRTQWSITLRHSRAENSSSPSRLHPCSSPSNKVWSLPVLRSAFAINPAGSVRWVIMHVPSGPRPCPAMSLCCFTCLTAGLSHGKLPHIFISPINLPLESGLL